jgi:4'-phosphopantetheinyl transferase
MTKPITHTKKPFKLLDMNTCTLETTRIDIWSFKLDAPLPAPGMDVLSAEETTRTRRFYFPHHQHHFARARIMLRLILARYLHEAPKNLLFAYGKHGKPYLENHTHLEFNLSHSGNHALLAVGKTHALGIDIEHFSDRPYQGIGKQVFSDEENKILAELTPTLKPLMFFNIWAQKEAFIKLLGLGLAYPTTRLTVPGLSREEHLVYDPIYHDTWGMVPFMSHVGYAAALCHHPIINTISMAECTL